MQEKNLAANVITHEQRLLAAIIRLSKINGKLEIKFLNSDNKRTDKLCLVFIKIPISYNMENKIRSLLSLNNPKPLSIGKLSIECGEHTTLFTGIIRIKSINNLGNVVYGFVDRMHKILYS